MTTTDREALAWAAGFFDGEGSTVGGKRGPRSVATSISIAQVDREPLDRFSQAVGGLGRVYGPIGGIGNARPHFIYRTNAFEETQAVVAMLWPWLGSAKREQALAVLRRFLVAQDRIRNECRIGHRLTAETTCPDGRCRLCRRAGQRSHYARRRPS